METNELLPVADWCFDNVPTHELRACLIWECARECSDLSLAEWVADLREQAKPSRWNRELQKFVKNPRNNRKVAAIQLAELNFDLDAHWKRLYSCHEAYTHFYYLALEHARPYSEPWQVLPQEFREHAVTQLGKSEVIKPFRAAYLAQLEILWNNNAVELLAIESGRKQPQYDDDAEMLRYQSVNPVEIPPEEGDVQSRELTAAFTINFSLFTDQEILDAFQLWLKEARLCPAPVRRGKKLNDDRAALDGIGMMRALHYFPFNSPRFPEPFKRRGSRACYKGRKLALTRYHELLPFVPQDSFPEAWATAAKWRASKSN